MTVPDFTGDPAGYAAYMNGLAMTGIELNAHPWKKFVTGQFPDGRPRCFSKFQMSFFLAPHRVRALFPGNRAGKTTSLGVEVNHVVRHVDYFRKRDKRVAQVLWFCVDFGQFELLKPQLEAECFDPGWKWNENDKEYTWPGGDKLYIKSDVRDWTYIQGINPDLVVIDEECPLGLYRELRARGFGSRDTRYIIGATATGMAGSWMEKEIYRPWLDFHAGLGLDEQTATVEQRHPDIWCCPRGGIADNPSMTADKVAGFRSLTWGSDKEKRVRDEGGFAYFAGDCVFDEVGLDWLRRRRNELVESLGAGETGSFDVRGAR